MRQLVKEHKDHKIFKLNKPVKGKSYEVESNVEVPFFGKLTIAFKTLDDCIHYIEKNQKR